MKFLIDIDGTLILEDRAINSSPGFIRYLDENSNKYLLGTNSIKSPEEQKSRLGSIGISIDEESIHGPIRVINEYVRQKGIKRVFIAGSESEIEQVEACHTQKDPQLAILLDFEKKNFCYEDLQAIYDLMQKGIPAVSASHSPYYFGRGRKLLDTGAFARLFEEASGRIIPVFGKPSPCFFNMAKKRLGDSLWVIGDDCRTDIAGAKKAGLNTILIRSGKYCKGDENLCDPDMVIDDLMELVPVLGRMG